MVGRGTGRLNGRAAGATFRKSPVDAPKLVDEIVEYANRARREGILALEKVLTGTSHPFLGKALTMAIDGADSTSLQLANGILNAGRVIERMILNLLDINKSEDGVPARPRLPR